MARKMCLLSKKKMVNCSKIASEQSTIVLEQWLELIGYGTDHFKVEMFGPPAQHRLWQNPNKEYDHTSYQLSSVVEGG